MMFGVALQVITIPDSRYAEYCAAPDFIKEHIFPGGHLPSISAMTACASSSHLVAVCLRDIGPDYAITLRTWRDNWMENWEKITELGYSETFMRKCVLELAVPSGVWFSGDLLSAQLQSL